MKKRKARNLTAAERRDVTIKAVIELAATANPGDITTAAIARHMNLTQGALFRHFPNKDAIWAAVMAWVGKELLARIDRAGEGIDDPLDAMQAMFLTHVAFVADHPGAPRMLYGELQGPTLTPAKRLARTLMEQYAARLHDLVADGVARRDMVPDLDAGAAVTLFIGMIQGLVMQSLMSGDPERMRTDAPRVFAIYRRGIARFQT